MHFRTLSHSCLAAVSGVLVGSAALATEDLYINAGVLNTNPPPQIDATAFANYGTFVANTTPPFDSPYLSSFASFPYEFSNTRFFTNAGTMTSQQGWIFDYAPDLGAREPAKRFVNDSTGTINAGTWLAIKADEVENRGNLGAGAFSRVEITGSSVDLANSQIDMNMLAGYGFGDQVVSNIFFPDVDILDYWWGGFEALNINLASFYEYDTNVGVIVTTPSYAVTNFAGGTGFDAFSLIAPLTQIYTNQVDDSNTICQAIFVGYNTNLLQAQARFSSFNTDTAYQVAGAQLLMIFTNSVTGQLSTETLYVTDALAARTNTGMYVNGDTLNSYRPANYRVSRPPLLDYQFGNAGNASPTTNLFYDPEMAYTTVTSIYTAYAPWVFSPLLIVPPEVPESTVMDLPGRVVVEADNLNLAGTRARANGVMSLTALHVESTANSALNAAGGFLFDLASTNGTLVLDAQVTGEAKVFEGPIFLWSAVWTNTSDVITTNIEPDPNDPTLSVTNLATNTVNHGFHTFLVDATLFGLTQEVSTHVLKLHSTNIVIQDNFNVIGDLLLDGENVEINGRLRYTQGQGNFGAVNAPKVQDLAINGRLEIPNNAVFGADRTGLKAPYRSFVNRGRVDASSIQIASHTVLNQGLIDVDYLFRVQADLGKFENGANVAGGDMFLQGMDLKFHQFTNRTTGSLLLQATNSLSDSGGPVQGEIQVNRGFRLNQKPRTGDLLGTRFVTSASQRVTVDHVWSADDRGAVADGFTDNVAMGRLVLSANPSGKLQFRGPTITSPYAIYVDDLNLANSVLDAYQNGRLGDYLSVAPNLTIYFATANVPAESLDGALNGRLRWVSEFAGPNSSVWVVLPSGQSVQRNRSLRESVMIDSDGDGLANGYDTTPFPDPVIKVTVSGTQPALAEISWAAEPLTTYEVQYSDGLGGEWVTLTTVTNPDTAIRTLQVTDQQPAGGQGRYYRLRYDR